MRQIAAKVGTPFYCYSTATFQRHFQVFNNALDGYDRKICFAVKANSNLAVLRVLAQQGAGADVVSEGEIRLALQAGIQPCDIVFSGVAKRKEEMRYALEQGIFQFNAESAAELEALNEVAASMGVKAPVALRVNPAVDPKTHEKISTGQKESKFGIAFEDVQRAYAHAASLSNLKVQGVSMHIGSQLTSMIPFRRAFRAILGMVNTLRADGHAISTLDLGGGLGIPYGVEEHNPPQPLDYAEAVREEIGAFDGTLLFEPGRMIAGNAGILVSEVLYVKETKRKRFLMIDAGMNDLMRPAMYDAYHEIIPVRDPATASGSEREGMNIRSQQAEPLVGEAVSLIAQASRPEREGIKYDIVGPVCESSCVFGKDRLLPVMQSGDLLAIRSCGAYGASMSNSYNARLLVPEVLVSGEQWAVIRNRPTYEDLAALQSTPEWL